MRVRHWLALAAISASAPLNAAAPLTNAQVLDCAVFMAAVMGTSEDKSVQQGVGFYFSWLVGRYEGETGKNIDADMSARALAISEDELAKIQPICVADMTSFGARLSKLGGLT